MHKKNTVFGYPPLEGSLNLHVPGSMPHMVHHVVCYLHNANICIIAFTVMFVTSITSKGGYHAQQQRTVHA